MQKTNSNLIKLVELLNDGNFHDGTSIGNQLNISRTAVWKAIKKLETYDIPITSAIRKGYRLESPLVLLNEQTIKSQLGKNDIEIDVLEKIDSTNNFLKTSIGNTNNLKICISEMQEQGKGRFNRYWHSPFGQNIYLSMHYPFQKDISELSGLSLVVSTSVCDAIESCCELSEPLQIKWPNDIVTKHGKIAGNFNEIQAESYGECTAIIGIGINVNMDKLSKRVIDQKWTSLRKITGEYHDRNILCASLIEHLLKNLDTFKSKSLSVFEDKLKQRNCLLNKIIQLSSGREKVTGTCQGISDQGHLILNTPDACQKIFSSGETTILKK